MEPSEPTSIRVRAALVLLVLFLVSVVAALAVTLASTPPSVGVVALALVTPILILSAVSIYLCWQEKIWGFAIGGVLGVVGVGFRLAISTQSQLEVGGGIPILVSALYITLGIMVSIMSFSSFIEIRARAYRR